MDAEKTFCEFFAGIGLVGEGLRLSGWACVYANDINAGQTATLRSIATAAAPTTTSKT